MVGGGPKFGKSEGDLNELRRRLEAGEYIPDQPSVIEGLSGARNAAEFRSMPPEVQLGEMEAHLWGRNLALIEEYIGVFYRSGPDIKKIRKQIKSGEGIRPVSEIDEDT